MKAAHGMVVTMHYTLRDDEGTVIDASEQQAPLSYLHGYDNIIPGLERALEGVETGFRSQVVVSPDNGYGEHDPEKVFEAPREQFPSDMEVAPGMSVYADGPEGPVPFMVLDVSEQSVVLDGNHPLAGVTLHFDVEVTDVRQATGEELEHGHVHGADGHHHHHD